MPEMHHYAVGQPYNPDRRRWPEAMQYNFRSGGHELVLFVPDPTLDEIEGVRTGKAEFSLVAFEETLFLLFQFAGDRPGGGVPWCDAPYQWWLVPDEERTLPNPEPTGQERALLNIVLVNAQDGLVQVLRTVSWSPDFTAAISRAIRQQARTAWLGPAAYDAALARIYRRYPTTDTMRAEETARTEGGA